jgi:hypothetical protein
MKKLKFDTLYESLILKEGTNPKEQRFANIKFNLPKILEILEDKESDDYRNVVLPYVRTWENQKYLGNLDHDQIQKILGHLVTSLEERVEEGENEISYGDLKNSISTVMQERPEFEKSNVAKARWALKFSNLFEKLKAAHNVSSENSSDSNSNETIDDENSLTTKSYLSLKDALLNYIQAVDSVTEDDASEHLVRKMGVDPAKAKQIIDNLISSGDLTKTEDGTLQVSKETREIESFGKVPDDDDSIETGIPFEDRPEYAGEDEDVEAAIRDAMQGDEEFARSGRSW